LRKGGGCCEHVRARARRFAGRRRFFSLTCPECRRAQRRSLQRREQTSRFGRPSKASPHSTHSSFAGWTRREALKAATWLGVRSRQEQPPLCEPRRVESVPERARRTEAGRLATAAPALLSPPPASFSAYPEEGCSTFHSPRSSTAIATATGRAQVRRNVQSAIGLRDAIVCRHRVLGRGRLVAARMGGYRSSDGGA
jgi:hypothetical protein